MLSEGRGLEHVSSTFPFADMKISYQDHVTWRSRAVFATRVGLCSCMCVWGIKVVIVFFFNNSSFRSLGIFFAFHFNFLNGVFRKNWSNFPFIVGPKRIFEQSFFTLYLSSLLLALSFNPFSIFSRYISL